MTQAELERDIFGGSDSELSSDDEGKHAATTYHKINSAQLVSYRP